MLSKRVSKDFLRKYAESLEIPQRLACELLYTIIDTLSKQTSINIEGFMYLECIKNEIYYSVFNGSIQKVEKRKKQKPLTEVQKTSKLLTNKQTIRRRKMGDLTELVAQINKLSTAFMTDATSRAVNGNQAAGARARKVSLELAEALKTFRKLSVVK